MRLLTRPEGSSAVDRAQDSAWATALDACAWENHVWNWAVGEDGSRSARERVARVNWGACWCWPEPEGATGMIVSVRFTEEEEEEAPYR
jgi:hypothetical protein